MKRLVLLFSLLAVFSFSLAACGGGGGGGGAQSRLNTVDKPGLAGNSKVTGKISADVKNALVSSPLAALVSSPLTQAFMDGQVDSVTGSKVPASVSSSGDYLMISQGGRTIAIPIKEINKHANGFRTYAGIINDADVIARLGGKSVPGGGLEYSSFGDWMSAGSIGSQSGGSQGLQVNTLDSMESFALWDKSRKTGLSGSGDFTGTASAAAYNVSGSGNGTVVPLVGRANLNMSSATNGKLNLVFADFYKFTGDVANTDKGVITGRFTNITDNGNNTGINLSTNIDDYNIRGENRIEGASLGLSQTSSKASEAVGVFLLELQNGSNTTGVSGAFGVKKQP